MGPRDSAFEQVAVGLLFQQLAFGAGSNLNSAPSIQIRLSMTAIHRVFAAAALGKRTPLPNFPAKSIAPNHFDGCSLTQCPPQVDITNFSNATGLAARRRQTYLGTNSL